MKTVEAGFRRMLKNWPDAPEAAIKAMQKFYYFGCMHVLFDTLKPEDKVSPDIEARLRAERDEILDWGFGQIDFEKLARDPQHLAALFESVAEALRGDGRADKDPASSKWADEIIRKMRGEQP